MDTIQGTGVCIVMGWRCSCGRADELLASEGAAADRRMSESQSRAGRCGTDGKLRQRRFDARYAAGAKFKHSVT